MDDGWSTTTADFNWWVTRCDQIRTKMNKVTGFTLYHRIFLLVVGFMSSPCERSIEGEFFPIWVLLRFPRRRLWTPICGSAARSTAMGSAMGWTLVMGCDNDSKMSHRWVPCKLLWNPGWVVYVTVIIQCFAINAAIFLVAVDFFRLGFCLMLATGRKVFQYISVIRADSPQWLIIFMVFWMCMHPSQ